MNAAQGHPATADADANEEEAASERYVANLRTLLATRIVPAIRRGIVATAASRPTALTIDVTDDPSPFNIGAKVDPDGSLEVRLSLGYATMHDSALDAVALAALLDRSGDLRRYLLYQLWAAHENAAHRARGEATLHVRSFAEFVGLEPNVTQPIFAQPDWRQSRDQVEADSLGWTIAYLLVRADAKLAGASATSPTGRAGGAARLAAASGWFPVPPVATALGIAEIERSPAAPFSERALLCSAARLMRAGVRGLHASPLWRSRLQADAQMKARVDEIESQIENMWRDGACASGRGVPTSVRGGRTALAADKVLVF